MGFNCCKIFMNCLETLKDHQIHFHKTDKRKRCVLCKKDYSCNSGLYTHLKLKHEKFVREFFPKYYAALDIVRWIQQFGTSSKITIIPFSHVNTIEKPHLIIQNFPEENCWLKLEIEETNKKIDNKLKESSNYSIPENNICFS